MQAPKSTCSICNRQFQVRFRYQVREEQGQFIYTCSQICHQRAITNQENRLTCSVCAKPFDLEFAYQVQSNDTEKHYFCSMPCREHAHEVRETRRQKTPSASHAPRRIAVFNHKGGTGKTTTAVNLAAGLAEHNQKILLVDADGQGNVGASLGIHGEKNLYHVLMGTCDVEDAVIPVRQNLDVLTSNELLAAAELQLATLPNRDRILRERLGDRVRGYDAIVIDCAPALSLMNQNALVYADSVLVPVGCDYLSLVGVRQVLRTLKNIHRLLKHRIQLLGVLPTFFDVRNKISRETIAAMNDHFGERCLPPIRVNTKLREAPSVKQTIFEYAPQSHGALDYRLLVDRIRSLRGDASWLDRSLERASVA